MTLSTLTNPSLLKNLLKFQKTQPTKPEARLFSEAIGYTKALKVRFLRISIVIERKLSFTICACISAHRDSQRLERDVHNGRSLPESCNYSADIISPTLFRRNGA